MRLNPGLFAEIERMLLSEGAGWGGPRIHAYLAAQRVHEPGCPKEACTCPLKWPGELGQPISLRTVQHTIQSVRKQWRVTAQPEAEANRALAITRLDTAVGIALREKNARDLISAIGRRAELDGSYTAAEDLRKPSLYQRVVSLIASLEDYTPPECEPPDITEPQGVQRFRLQRLERLLLKADNGCAQFRSLGDPQGLPETARLTLRRNQLDTMLYQTLTNPVVPPSEKRDAIIKAAGTASMITEATSLAETAAALEKRISGG